MKVYYHYWFAHSFICLFIHLTHVYFLFFIFLKINYFIYFYFWLRWVFVAVRGLLIAVASLIAEHGTRVSVVVAHGPSCSAACGICLGQGSNLCPLHWQADSQPLRHQGSPHTCLLSTYYVPGTLRGAEATTVNRQKFILVVERGHLQVHESIT